MAKNITAESLGIIVDAIITYVIVNKLLKSKTEKGFRKLIKPAMIRFVDLHLSIDKELNDLLPLDSMGARLLVWRRRVDEIIITINSLRLYEVYPDISGNMLKYAMDLDGIRKAYAGQSSLNNFGDVIFPHFSSIYNDCVKVGLVDRPTLDILNVLTDFKASLSSAIPVNIEFN